MEVNKLNIFLDVSAVSMDGLGKVKNRLEKMQYFARYCVKALHVAVIDIAFLPIRLDERSCGLIGRFIRDNVIRHEHVYACAQICHKGCWRAREERSILRAHST